jgi:hypothetical protein
MSGVAVVRYLLANDATLTATVPGTRIMAGILPINTTLPAISITQISGGRLGVIKHGSNEHITDRVQVTVLATTYPQQKTILNLVKNALPSIRGTINSVVVDSIQQDFTGPDLYNDDPIIYEQSVDYFVKYIA